MTMKQTFRRLVCQMKKADFARMSQAERRDILFLYRELAEPMDHLWMAMTAPLDDKKPLTTDQKKRRV